MALDKQLTGRNFCGLDCVDNQNVIHPETCVDNVITDNIGGKTLNDWLSYGTEENVEHGAGTFTSTTGLLQWLEYYYPVGSYSLPIASADTLGGIKVGSHLVINDGVLSVRSRDLVPTDSSALLIAKFANPEEGSTPNLYPADWDGRGVINLGNNTQLPVDFSDGAIIDVNYITYPLRLDSQNRAGVSVPQPDWTAISGGGVILHKPTIPTVNDSTIIITQGGVTKGTFTLNQNSDPYTVALDGNSSTTNFVGATASTDGVAGLVPAPSISDRSKVLCGNGSWDNPNMELHDYTHGTAPVHTTDIAYDSSGETTITPPLKLASGHGITFKALENNSNVVVGMCIEMNNYDHISGEAVYVSSGSDYAGVPIHSNLNSKVKVGSVEQQATPDLLYINLYDVVNAINQDSSLKSALKTALDIS